MAKFHNYYVLCPLIDQKSFLGVSRDKETDNLVVTLGRNVVNKYRLTDQKQLSGWTSRDHITSAVVFDEEQESYVGIFNNNTIKVWKEDGDNLDKVKKYKLPINILKIIPRQNKASIIVFVNGNCASLPYAIDNRKTFENKPLIKDRETIVDILCYTLNGADYICYIVKNSKDNYEIVNCEIREEIGDLVKSTLNKVKVQRTEDVYVVGHLLNTDDKVQLVYVLWSDAKMTVYDLTKKSWKTIGTVPWISTSTNVSIAKMGKFHLILFGSNADQDGAIIVGYNITLGVGFCKYPMKIYTEGAKLYCYSDRIILESSNHIGVLPYVLQIKRNLSSLLGSHEVVQDETTNIASWDTVTEPLFDVPQELEKPLKLGLTERTICTQVIPPLLEKSSPEKIMTVLSEFTDIPESVLVHLLNYCLKNVDTSNVDLADLEQFISFCKKQESEDSFELLNHLFKITFSDSLLIPHLRNVLTLDNSLFILSYISYLLMDSEIPIDSNYEGKLLDWCILLMDAFYQQYVMTRDAKVTFVLKKTLNVVITFTKYLGLMNETMKSLTKLLSGRESVNEDSLSYSIEIMQI